MQSILIAILIFLIAFYVTAMLLAKIGLRRLAKRQALPSTSHNPGKWPKVAIIVSARNEAENLPGLIRCLTRQNYPRDKLEICIIDDRSEDASWSILRKAMAAHPSLRALRIDDELPYFAPKKRALDRGILQTRGEILLFTDADCRPKPSWVQSMVSFYDSDTVAVAGYSPLYYRRPVPRLIEGMLSLDMFAISAVAAASIGLGRPLTAAGGNLSYRRQTYFAAGGFEPIGQWISGDDDLFIQQIARKHLGTYAFATHPDAFSPTEAPRNWQEFHHQRIRYASKSRHYHPAMIAALVAVYLLNAFIVFGGISLLFGAMPIGLAAAAAWAIKSLAERSFIRQAANIFGERRLLPWFWPTALLHPLYIVVFAFLGLFARFKWKNETFSKTRKSRTVFTDG